RLGKVDVDSELSQQPNRADPYLGKELIYQTSDKQRSSHSSSPSRNTDGSNSSGKNLPVIGCPLGVAGTPSSGGESEADLTPSRNTLITAARRGCVVRFS